MPADHRLYLQGVIAACAACFTISLLGCGGSNGDSVIGASVDNLRSDPNAYYGSRLTVSGTVDEVISPTMFTMRGSSAENHLVVVSVDSIAPTADRTMTEPVLEDDIVQVTGRVREFMASDLESEFGVSLPDDAAEFDGQPMIVARNASATLSSIVVTPRPRDMATPPGEAELITDLSVIAGRDAGELSGEAVHLRNVAVSSGVEERTFWAASGGDSVFVVLISGALGSEALQETESWEVFGILRRLPSSSVLAAEWELPDDVTRQLEGETVYLHGIHAVPSE